MDKIIRAAAETAIQPFMEQFRKRYKNELITQTFARGGMPKSAKILDAEVDRGCEEAVKFLLGEEEVDRMEMGFETVLKELDSFPNKEKVLQDFKQAGDKMIAEPDGSEEIDLPVFDTIQEMFGLQDETFETLYQIASRLYNTQRTEEALNVLVLLTTLNNFVFEPWLGLGSCWLIVKKYTEALQAFSMATLLKFNHPAPHLYAAECYLGLGNQSLAKETLQLALSLMDAEQKKSFKGHIDFLQSKLK